MRKSTIFSFVTLASRMDPLAREKLCLVAILTLGLTPLTIIGHEVFAEVKLQIVGGLRNDRFSLSWLRVLTPGASIFSIVEFLSLRLFGHFF